MEHKEKICSLESELFYTLYVPLEFVLEIEIQQIESYSIRLLYFSTISLFLKQALTEYIEWVCRWQSELFFDSICSIRIGSRNWDIDEKLKVPWINGLSIDTSRLKHQCQIDQFILQCLADGGTLGTHRITVESHVVLSLHCNCHYFWRLGRKVLMTAQNPIFRIFSILF